MKVLIETPKYGFRKYRWDGRDFTLDLVSPLPTLFNYGCILGTTSGDGQPRDAIVLGPRLPQGRQIEVTGIAVVGFTDDGARDDKTVCRETGKTPDISTQIPPLMRLMIDSFFQQSTDFCCYFGIPLPSTRT